MLGPRSGDRSQTAPRRTGRRIEESENTSMMPFCMIRTGITKEEGRREGGKEGRREGGKEGRREGGKEGRREGGKEGRREGGKEGRRGEGRGEKGMRGYLREIPETSH